MLDALIRDLHFSWRAFRRRPTFTLTVVATLTLGLGASSAIVTVVDAVLLHPLPFPEPSGLVMVWMHNPREGIEKDITSWPNFSDWREQSRSFRQMVAVRPMRRNLTGAGEPEELRGALVSAGFFAMLGAEPALGRGLRDGENEVGAHRVAVLSHELWTRRFGADPQLVGRDIELDGEPFTVVGVTGPGMRYPRDAELWLPLAFTENVAGLREARSSYWLPVVGRLADGVDLAGAQAEMTTIADRLAAAHPENEELGVLLEPLGESLIGSARPALLLLLGAVTFVLLIACVNVANLLLVHGAARGDEMAVRAALGASRPLIVRQLLTESAILGMVGGVAGLAFGAAAVRLLLGLAPATIGEHGEIGLDARLIAFGLALALCASLLCAALPAWRSASRARTGQLAGARVIRRGGVAQPVMVMAQFALALVLLAGAGLMVRSLLALGRVDPGFDPRNTLTATISLPPRSYPDDASMRAFFERLLEQLRAQPGVQEADMVTNVFLSRLPQSAPVSIEGRPDLSEADRNLPIAYDAVSPGLLRTLRIPLVEGRMLTDADGPDGPRIALANQAFARRFLPEGHAVGARFVFGSPGDAPRWIEVVGVVGDARRSGLDQPARPSVFLPYSQYTPERMTLVVRTAGEPLGLADTVRRTVTGLDPRQPIANVRTLQQEFGESTADRRFLMTVLGVFAGLSTALAAVGLYGVMAYRVARRSRDLGLRLALGARRGTVLGGVLGEALLQAVAGLAAGMLGSLMLGRLMAAHLFGIGPHDATTFAGVSLVLVAVALVASFLPAWLASRIDPIAALRAD